MNIQSKIFIAGHNGLAGSAILRALIREGYQNVVTSSKKDLDLSDKTAVQSFFEKERPEYVFLAAAKVGGIYANDAFAAEFIYKNLEIQNSVIHSSYTYGVKKLLFMGSICIYPKFASEPVNESSLLCGPLEPSNEWYAIAKIAGIKMCQAYRKQYGCNFISAMPCNIYGINDNFHEKNGHVLPALLSRFHNATLKNDPSVTCWGDGSPRREFLNSEDLASALLFLMVNYNEKDVINTGYGSDYSIKEISDILKKETGFNGEVLWDKSKPNGTPRRLLDCKKIFDLGWKPKIPLDEGLSKTYEWFKNNYSSIRK